MTDERSLKIVRNHRPVQVPPGAAEAALTGTVALVLSTYRSSSPDMVLDHQLWLACMEEVGEVVCAESTEVTAEPEPRFLDRFRARRTGRALGPLDAYGRRLLCDPSTPEWQFVLWRREDRLVAVAACEPWYRVGGPPRYHDSYTSCVFVEPGTTAELARAIDLRARKEGAGVEEIVDASQSGGA